MSSVEIFAIAVGLWLGYLIVSHIMGRKSTDGASRSSDAENRDGPGATSRGAPEKDCSTWDSVLEISRHSSIDEIRQAYRSQMSKYHPDKVASLGREFKVIAERKAKDINAAYVAAMKEKGANA